MRVPVAVRLVANCCSPFTLPYLHHGVKRLVPATKYAWRSGSARTRWRSLCAPPDPIAAMGAYFVGERREGQGEYRINAVLLAPVLFMLVKLVDNSQLTYLQRQFQGVGDAVLRGLCD